MILDAKLLYNAIALNHVAKKGWEMESDLNNVLKDENVTVGKLLNMDAKDFYKTNANEVLSTTQVGFGKEFVEETILAKELIERLETNDSLLVDATIKLMSWKSVNYPVRGKKVRMSLQIENLNDPKGQSNPTSQVKKPPTASINLTAKTMKITVYYSDDWMEDSVINVAEYVLSSIADAYETSIHEVLINGDITTGATANINIIDGNTSALPDGDKTDLLLANWGRKVAFDNGATVDALTNLVIANLRTARASMGVKWLDPSKLRLVPDTQTYFDLLNLTEVETIEKFGDSATIKDWVLVALDWIKIVNREEMLQALITGKQSATPASNILGAIMIIHTPSVNVWIRKGLTTETSRDAELSTTGVTGRARIAVTLDNTQNNVAPTSPSALIVNI